MALRFSNTFYIIFRNYNILKSFYWRISLLIPHLDIIFVVIIISLLHARRSYILHILTSLYRLLCLTSRNIYYAPERVQIWKWSPAHALGGVSGVASFITTGEQLQINRGCCFLVRAMLPEGFPFHQFNIDSRIKHRQSWNPVT